MRYLISAIIILAVLAACNSAKKTKTKTEEPKISIPETAPEIRQLVSFKKGGCFGRCPIYEITIYENGMALYNGERFTDRLGKHEKMLPAKTLTALKAAMGGIDFFSLPDKYESRIPDLASSTLTYYKGAKTKTIFWRENADEGLKALGKQIEAIAGIEEGWKLDENQALPAGAIANELIVNLQKEVDAKRFVASYSQYGMRVKERINPNGNYWLLEYDTNKIKPIVMLQKMNQNEQVIQAEFNKRLTQRN